MSALIGALRVSLSMDTAAFEKGANIAQKRAAAMGKNIQAMGDKLTGLGTKLSVGLTLPFTALLTKAIPAALESREAIGQVNAALQSMGPVAGYTSGQLQKMAAELQHLSKYDDDEILRKVTANMLTFGNISGESFERAQTAAVNLAARLGEDLQSAAIQVGKALNDPIKGVTALRRVGVQLTQQQQEQVKAMVAAGNVAGAQKIILGELEREFGGAAKAMREASPAADLQEKWRTFQEVVGEIALKVLPPLTSFLTALLKAFNALPTPIQGTVVVLAALGAGLGPVLIGLGSLITLVGKSALLVQFAAGLTGIGVAEGVAATGATAAGIAIRTMLGPISLAIAAATALYFAWKNWDKIKVIVQNMVTAVADKLRQLAGPFDWVKKKVTEVGNFFHNLYDRVVGHSYIPDMVDEIGQHMGRLSGLLVDPAQKTAKAAGDAFEALKGRVSALLDRLYPDQARFNQFKQDLQDLEAYAKKTGMSVDALADATARLRNELQPGLGSLQVSGDLLNPQPLDMIGGQASDWQQGLGETLDASRSLTGQIAGGLADALSRVTEGWKAMRDTALMALRDIVQELIRVAAFKFIMNLLGGGSSGGGLNIPSTTLFGVSLPGTRAVGGPVIGGKPYIVGERGPELFVPHGHGDIVPNHSLGSGAFHFNVTVHGAMSDAQARRTGTQIAAGARAEIARSTSKGFG